MFHTISNIDNTINLEQYINNRNGNKAIKKLNAIALALVVKAPLAIPITYNSNKS